MMSLPLSGSEADHLLLAALGLAGAVLLFLAARRWSVVLAVAYLGVMCFVPIWSGVSAGVYWPPQVLMGVVVLAVALPRIRGLGVRPARVDLLVLALGVVSVAPLLTGGATLASVVVVLVKYLGAYLVGRLLPSLVGEARLLRVFVAVFGLLAVLTLLEYVSGINIFQGFPGSPALHAQWDEIQIRGGVPRAEGAFGHSIALGATLATAVPLVLAAPVRSWLRMVVGVAMLAAVVVTFSRIGLITAAFGLVLCLVAATELTGRLRVWLTVLGAAVAVVAQPLVTEVFTAAGDEAAGSAAYRGRLLELVPDIEFLGLSRAFSRTPDGSVNFGAFESIDSALILHGLTYGWLSLGLVIGLLVIAAGAVLTRRASPATIAVVAQVPALATVALITQYSTMIWFVGGLAVWAQAARAGRLQLPPPEPGPPLPAGVDEGSEPRVPASASGPRHSAPGTGVERP